MESTIWVEVKIERCHFKFGNNTSSLKISHCVRGYSDVLITLCLQKILINQIRIKNQKKKHYFIHI